MYLQGSSIKALLNAINNNMIMLVNFFLNTPTFLFIMIFISLGLKSILLSILASSLFRSRIIIKPCLFLITMVVASMVGEIAWAFKLCRNLLFPDIPFSVVVFFVRIAWGFLVVQYQALSLFMRSLTQQNYKNTFTQKILLGMSFSFFIYFVFIAFFENNLLTEEERNIAFSFISFQSKYLEVIVMRCTTIYIFILLVMPTLCAVIRTLRAQALPKILHHQLTMILKYLMIPYLIAELLLAAEFECVSLSKYTYLLVGVSVILITLIVYYCIRKVTNLRFLNVISHVKSTPHFNFIDDFKIVLEQLSLATTRQELTQLTATFLKDSCNIPLKKVTLHIRNQISGIQDKEAAPFECQAEEYFNKSEILTTLKKQKILIYDELAFSNFYECDPARTHLLAFLKHINADIFLPIFEKQQIIAYIIVESNARPTQLYSNVERDEMLVFASYLGNIINLLQHRNFEAILAQEKELKDELYKKNQENTHYKESIRSFLKNGKQKAIGIIFYRQRRFLFANQMAKEMVKININTQEGHPLTRSLKEIAQHVQEYKSPQSIIFKDSDGSRIVISGVLNLEHNNVIIILSYPDISDIITKQLNLLKDPSKWDYVLYLESTKPGQLINQLIPGNGETLLNFKINLLQTALTKKVSLLEMPAQDLMTTVELLHHISKRETICTIALDESTEKLESASKIFGIHPIFGIQSNKPFLEKLDGIGTLFIKNIEYLDKELQEYLAEYIQFGMYRSYKSDRKFYSDVRIICSTNASLIQLVQEGKFSPLLFNELKKTCISFPSLQLLSEEELRELALGYTQQAVKIEDFRNLLELNEKEKIKLMMSKPVSLHELKLKVQQLLQQKSKKNNIEQEIQFDPAYDISDPELFQASRLGKQALKDHKIMVLLWNKFKNQNKIATFLGVNRSSVNRRCKEYNLEA